MKCKKCGTEFAEGIFCPECGTKYSLDKCIEKPAETTDEMNGNEFERASMVIDTHEMTEDEEIKMISKLGWSNVENIYERLHARVEIYKRVQSMRVQTASAKQKVAKMKQDIKRDYGEVKKKDGSYGVQIFWACVFSLLAINFLFPLGILGIIFGIMVIWASWGAVGDIKKARECINELDDFMKTL